MPELKDILTAIREKHGNKSQVAKKLDIPSQLLGQYEKGKRKPKQGFYDKWLEVFNQDLQALLKHPSNEANVSHETEKHTPVKESNGYKNMSINRDEVYKTIVEGHTEYVLVPRDMMKDTQIVSNTQLAKDKAYMEALIEFNRDLLSKIPNAPKVQDPPFLTIKVQGRFVDVHRMFIENTI